MPTYSYACTACDHRFDAVQSFTDQTLTDCPECSGRLRKLFVPVGVVFKGSGFYRTDSRSAPPRESGSTDKSGNSDKPKSEKPASESGSTTKAASDSAKKPGAPSSSTKSGSANSTSS